MTRRDRLTSALRPADGGTAPARPTGPGTIRCDRCGTVMACPADGSVPRGWFRLLPRPVEQPNGWLRRLLQLPGRVEYVAELLCPRCLAPYVADAGEFWKGGAR